MRSPLNQEKVLVGLKYDVDKKLKVFLDDVEKFKIADIVQFNNGNKQVVYVNDNLRVDLHIGKDYTQVGLMNMQNESGRTSINTGVYMFLSSVEKLLRYLNKRFNFTEKTKSDVNSYEHDNFF